MKSESFITNSEKETSSLAKRIAKELTQKDLAGKALIIGLTGELGAGKTTFIKSFMRELGIRNKITSPTFIILRRFKLPKGGNYKNIFHIDAYRLSKEKELSEIGIDKEMKNPENIILIEWADRIEKVLPKGTIWLKFKYGKNRNERHIIIN